MSLTSDSAVHVAYDDHVSHDPATPERNLMRAILKIAMDDLRKSGELHRDARAYVLSNDDDYLYSFISICAHLNVCPHTIRKICGLAQGWDSASIAA